MARAIAAIASVLRLPAYQAAVLQDALAIARLRTGPIGVFMGYDFHIGADGPKLIEINTNAGGALINAYVAAAQRACCAEVDSALPRSGDAVALLDAFAATLEAEWRRQGRTTPLARVAIVDDEPEQQYLFPEFLLFQRLFRSRGIDAVIADPRALTHRDGAVWNDGKPIDLIYNRLTDFDLGAPEHAAVRAGYIADDVVVTPNPWSHAVFANKRNLAVLGDVERLRAWGVDAEDMRPWPQPFHAPKL